MRYWCVHLVVVTGHRGAAGLEPENTLRSINRALEIGVDQVEIDIHQTRDGHLVVIHDERVDRTTDGHGLVKDLTLEEIRKLDAGKGEHVPTLDEVIALVKGKVTLQIELKSLNIEEEAVRTIEENDLVKNVVVTSFHHKMLKNVKKINWKIETGVLFYCYPVKAWQLARNSMAEAIHPNIKFVDRDLVRDAHKRGLKVRVWNTDEEKEMKNLIELEVDAIGSDRPDILVKVAENPQ